VPSFFLDILISSFLRDKRRYLIEYNIGQAAFCPKVTSWRPDSIQLLYCERKPDSGVEEVVVRGSACGDTGGSGISWLLPDGFLAEVGFKKTAIIYFGVSSTTVKEMSKAWPRKTKRCYTRTNWWR
jgi:hypothetical protein